jgi:transposase
MNEREQRGMELAERVNIQPVGKELGKWIVPSATSSERYTVDLNDNQQRCTCADWELRHCKCKHIFAVEYTILWQRQTSVATESIKGHTVKTETVTETVTATKRTVYRQDWPAYNAAQTSEKATFQVLLFDLCKSVPNAPQGMGRARLPLSEMIFSAAFKVYSTVSTRRFISDLEDAKEKGYLSKVPHFNTILNYLETEGLTPILHGLIRQSSEPLRGVERDFAVDSSGFSGSKFEKWSYVKFNADRKDFVEHQQRTDWLKLHLMCGVKTNIVTSVEISGRNDHDTKFLAPLVNDTAQRFMLKEVSADKAYSSRDNLNTIAAHKAIPLIPFRVNANGGALARGEKASDGHSDLWLDMWRFYNFHTDQFMEHYHKRSNVESTFAMIKGKFGNGLRSKGKTAQINEALCKVLCHNICVVIQSIHELGIEATFCAELNPAQKVPQ